MVSNLFEAVEHLQIKNLILLALPMMAYFNFWVQLLVSSWEHLEENSLDKSFSINGWETLLQ
jgi:hypothetical protein